MSMKTWLLWLGGVALFAAVPSLVTVPYFRVIFILFFIYLLLALSINIPMGFLELFSFGHAAFFALGAYTAAILAARLHWGFWPTLLPAVVISGVGGVLVALSAARLRGVYFAIATLALAQIVYIILLGAMSLTRGPMGLLVPSQPAPFGIARALSYHGVFYYIAGGCALLAMLLTYRLARSSLGQTFILIRENEHLARSVGVPVFRYRLIGTGISAAMAGVAGWLYVFYYGIASPSLAGVHYTALPLLMVLVGGRGTLIGPVLGTALFTALPEVLRPAGEVQDAVFGLLLIAILLWMPRGLGPGLARWLRLPAK